MAVLVEPRRSAASRTRTLQPAVNTAWRWIGRFGFLMALIGFADSALHWYPLAFHSPEWEFTAVSMSFGPLPLVTIGLAALLGSFAARGVRGGVVATAAVCLVLAGLIGAAYVLFLTDVPLALKAATGPAGLTLKKAIARTTVLGVGFGTAYLIAGVAALRHSSRSTENA